MRREREATKTREGHDGKREEVVDGWRCLENDEMMTIRDPGPLYLSKPPRPLFFFCHILVLVFSNAR